MKEKANFKNHYINMWKEHFGKEDTLAGLFSDLGISDVIVKNSVTPYEIDDERFGVIASTTQKDNGSLDKILIDFKVGEPTWQQMMDVTFDTGSDCEKRIVMFHAPEEQEDYSDSSADRNLAGSFSQITNDCGFDTWLIRTSVPVNDFRTEPKYDILQGPSQKRFTKHRKLPSKSRFEKAEFWVIYYDCFLGHFAGDGPTAKFNPACWMDYCSIRDGRFTFMPTWTNEGFFMHAISDGETLQWIRDHKRDAIRDRYQNCRIKLHKKEGVPYKLSVRIWEKPFREFTGASPAEKHNYADAVHGDEWEFYQFIEGLVSDMESERKTANG